MQVLLTDKDFRKIAFNKKSNYKLHIVFMQLRGKAMPASKVLISSVLLVLGTATIAYSAYSHRVAVPDFYSGHTHTMTGSQHITGTEGAPSHSGGLDRSGCHNASVPYHCH